MGGFIKNNTFGAVTAKRFVDYLSNQYQLNLDSFYNDWFPTQGYPVVKLDYFWQSKGQLEVTISQAKDSLENSMNKYRPRSISIHAYILYRGDLNLKKVYIGELDTFIGNFTLSTNTDVAAIFLNPDRASFFRTDYSTIEIPSSVVAHLPANDRLGWVSDTIQNLISMRAKTNKNNFIDHLNQTLGFLANEKSPETWLGVIMVLERFQLVLFDTPMYQMYLYWIKQVIKDIVKSIIRGNESPLSAIRNAFLMWCLKLEDETTIDYALDSFNHSLSLEDFVYEGAIRFGNCSNFEKILASNHLSLETISTLASSRNETQQLILLDHFKNNSKTVPTILSRYLYYGDYEIVWKHFKQHPDVKVDLESCIVQMRKKSYILEAQALAKTVPPIKSGLERQKSYELFRQWIQQS